MFSVNDPVSGITYDHMFGGYIPANIWKDVMSSYIEGMPVKDFSAPPEPETGQVPSVIGKGQDEALAILAEAHFVGVVDGTVPLRRSRSGPSRPGRRSGGSTEELGIPGAPEGVGRRSAEARAVPGVGRQVAGRCLDDPARPPGSACR
jgi:hypothetical protein